MEQTAAPRHISVDQAVGIAIGYLQENRVQEAAALCRRIRDVVPQHADATHYLGMATYRLGEVDEGIRLTRESLAIAPGQADWHSNLGIMLQSQDKLEEAMAEFERAIALQPAHANARNNLGVLLRVFGRYAEAEAQYRQVIAIDPNHGDAYHNLAIVLDLTDRTAEAVSAYYKALTLRADPDTRRLLALGYCMLGEREKAIEVCEEWLRSSPNDPRARHTLAACSGRDVPPRASDDYIRDVFDRFASHFEERLGRLQYRAPALVSEALAEAGLVPSQALDVLDVGCGTGLCGPLLAPYARRLIGVDLSKEMLEHARTKGTYGELWEAELTAYLQQHREAADIIVSADTLVYFGVLEDVVTAAAQALRPGGLFVFTLEEAVAPVAAQAYALQPHGRYVHRAEYVERLLRGAGLEPHIGRAQLRKESGEPVAGLVVRARRTGAGPDASDRDAASGGSRWHG